MEVRLEAKEFYEIAKRFINETREMSRFFDKVDSKMMEWKDSQFDSEGSFMGNGWKPLKESTIKQRLASGFGTGPILQRTGKLKKSIKMVFRGPQEAKWSGTVDYYKYHQTGTSKMPQRQILGWSDAMKTRAVNEFKGFIILLLTK